MTEANALKPDGWRLDRYSLEQCRLEQHRTRYTLQLIDKRLEEFMEDLHSRLLEKGEGDPHNVEGLAKVRIGEARRIIAKELAP